ncbi:Zinc-type alcohol dehydrogenase-like protein [Paramyrothecium foliicola]|nr:Zinc-type alcohol dehydrogenase-like protein [Paramyrothecium foliicola]
MATETMRAWLYSSAATGLHKSLSLHNAARHVRPTGPTALAKGELLIRVRASSLNVADYKLPELPYGMGRMAISVPASPGMDFAGTVVASSKVGPLFTEGDNVFGRLDPCQFGTLGEYIVARDSWCAKLPDAVSMEQASGLGSAAQAALISVAPYVPEPTKEGSNANKRFHVLVNGVGGVGSYTVQIAKVLGCRVTAVASTGKADLCKNLGADEVIDYTKGDLVTALKAGGQIFDHVVDNVGLPYDLYKAASEFLKPSGTFVQVGADMSGAGMANLTSRILRPSFLGGHSRKFALLQVKTKQQDLERLGAWVADGKIKTVIDEVFEWDNAPKAIEKLRQGHAAGKIVIKGPE